MTASRPALRARAIDVSIGGKAIVHDASLALRAGEVTVILGPNGAGKSTLLSVAAGLRRPEAGTVLLGDAAVETFSARNLAQRRAVMPQRTPITFAFTVREVVAMGRIAFESADNDEKVSEALELTDLEAFSERSVTTLSGGEQQRVNFARVVAQVLPAHSGAVLLLDEPTAAMDIAHVEHTLEVVRQLADGGVAVGMVLHDLDAAASHADQVVLMEAGRVRATGSVADVCTPELLSEVYRTELTMVEVEGRARILPRR